MYIYNTDMISLSLSMYIYIYIYICYMCNTYIYIYIYIHISYWRLMKVGVQVSSFAVDHFTALSLQFQISTFTVSNLHFASSVTVSSQVSRLRLYSSRRVFLKFPERCLIRRPFFYRRNVSGWLETRLAQITVNYLIIAYVVVCSR